MWYEVPKTPSYQKPKPIFPWEKEAPKPTRVFPEDEEYDRRMSTESVATGTTETTDVTEVTDVTESTETTEVPDVPEVSEVPEALEVPEVPEVSEVPEEKDESVEPTTPTATVPLVDPWETFSLRNAWDEIPEIKRYISALQKNRKGNIQMLQGYGSGVPQRFGPDGRRPSIRLTDFPTEVERPSLPVTPAPIRRPSFWGIERDDDGELPAAEGVPSQAEWV
jgi:glycogenin glucosyltransferase